MLRTKLLNTTFALLVGISIIFAGCDLGADDPTTTFEVQMHDATTDELEQFNVHVKSIEAHRDGDGWKTIGTPDEVYNLLELVNGNKVVLGEEVVESGRYTQVRLILGEQNSVVNRNGESYDLSVPSGVQTGIKLVINAELEEGVRYKLNLDFDASKSLTKTGESPQVEYILRPVIHAYEEALTGTIGGSVTPVEANARIDVFIADSVFTTTYADETTGDFLLIGLEPQTYDSVVVEATDTEGTYNSATITDGLEVVAGEKTELGEIDISSE